MAIPTTSGSPAFTTYDLSVGIKLDIEDAIWLISPFDVPLQGAMGADGRVSLSSASCFEKKVEWLDETLLTPSSTQGTTGPISNDTQTLLQLAHGTQLNFQPGDVILMDGEYMLVGSYGTTADTLVVTRNFGGTSITTSTVGDVIISVGSALAEGSNPPAARAVDRTDRYNLTQVFGPVAVNVSQSEQAVQKYGLRSTEFDHQVMNRTKEQFITFEQALLYGTLTAGTNAGSRTMGGFTYYITTNSPSDTVLTEATLLPALESCFDAGGNPDRLVLGAYQKRQFSNSLFGPSSAYGAVRYPQDGNARGTVIDYYDSDFGQVAIVLDRWVKKTDAFVFSRDQAEINTLRPMSFEMLAKTGDAINGQIVAEKTLKFRRQSWAAAFDSLT